MSGNKWDDRVERYADRFEDRPFRTAFGWLLKGLLILAVLMVVVGGFLRVTGFLGLWADEATRVVSPANVREQHTLIAQDWQELRAAADKVCQAGASQTGGENDPTFLEDPLVAMKSVYYTARSDYNRRMNNLFEARIVAPSGYPRYVPELPATLNPNGDWCKVSRQLANYHQ